jgi:hypothetical protein
MVMRYNFALALPFVAALLVNGPPGQAQTLDAAAATAQEQAFAGALGCTKQRAEAVALNAVGGGRVVQVVFESQDHPPHWSVDIVGSRNEHEVWVNAACKVIKIITQAL